MRQLLCLLLMCSCAVVAQDGGAKPQTNLLQNPGFEEGDAAPAPWQFSTAMPGNFETAFAKDAHSGARSIRLVTKTPSMSGYWAQTVPVEPNTEYLLECWIKLNGGKVLMYVSGQGEEQDKANRAYAESSSTNPLVPVFLKPEYVPGIPADGKWHRIELRFKTLPTANQVNVNIGSYFRDGEVFIDDVKLVKVPATTEATGAVTPVARPVQPQPSPSTQGNAAGDTGSKDKEKKD